HPSRARRHRDRAARASPAHSLTRGERRILATAATPGGVSVNALGATTPRRRPWTVFEPRQPYCPASPCRPGTIAVRLLNR
ncbi:MAG: hypothetical protein M3495_17770, partial [Pseudomonadota bacterium]|nr:hypothetical protein [Pseudomonadota bacterium]